MECQGDGGGGGGELCPLSAEVSGSVSSCFTDEEEEEENSLEGPDCHFRLPPPGVAQLHHGHQGESPAVRGGADADHHGELLRLFSAPPSSSTSSSTLPVKSLDTL